MWVKTTFPEKIEYSITPDNCQKPIIKVFYELKEELWKVEIANTITYSLNVEKYDLEGAKSQAFNLLNKHLIEITDWLKVKIQK